jgi:hypothetical protein
LAMFNRLTVVEGHERARLSVWQARLGVWVSVGSGFDDE